jgi:hypothetical protein
MERSVQCSNSNPPPTDRIWIVSGNAQYALPGAAFAHPLVVKVLDAHASPSPHNAQITFTISATAGPASDAAVFVNGQTRTTVPIRQGDGLASSPAIIARQVGPIQVTVTISGRSPGPKVTFDLDVVGPPPTSVCRRNIRS